MVQKILFIGDPHIKLNNLELIDMLQKQALQLVMDKNVDKVVIGGDVLHNHERLHTTTLNRACTFIEAFCQRVQTYVLVGNHDYENNQQFLTNRHWMNALKQWPNCTIVDQCMVIDGEIVMVPYVPPGRFQEALDTVKVDLNLIKCLFAHQEFYGCRMGAIESNDGDKWSINHPLVVSGHIHSKQRPQPNIVYPGSALQHAFGESESSDMVIVTINDRVHLEEVEVMVPKMRTITVAIDKFESLKITIQPNERVRVICKGSVEAFKALKKTKRFKEVEAIAKVQFRLVGENQPQTTTMAQTATFETILDGLILKLNNGYVMDLYKNLKVA